MMNRQPRFVIVNTCDAPHRGNVAEWVEGVGYCYMIRKTDVLRKSFDGMNPRRPTPLEEFGFAVRVADTQATFVRCGDSTATYEDGKPRAWQDRAHSESFTLPLVKGVKKLKVRA